MIASLSLSLSYLRKFHWVADNNFLVKSNRISNVIVIQFVSVHIKSVPRRIILSEREVWFLSQPCHVSIQKYKRFVSVSLATLNQVRISWIRLSSVQLDPKDGWIGDIILGIRLKIAELVLKHKQLPINNKECFLSRRFAFTGPLIFQVFTCDNVTINELHEP